MAKLSKAEIKKHNQILDLIHSDKPLSFDEKWDILENYNEGAEHVNSLAGAFFTPVLYSRDFSLEVFGDTVIDLCAGLGSLSFFVMNKYNPDEIPKQLVCVEINHDYAEIGKRIVPEADWIVMDALQFSTETLFEQCISNPPYGKIKTSDVQLEYTGSEFEYKIISKASTIAQYGTFILPQRSAGFVYSGRRFYERDESNKYKKFNKETGIVLNPGIGIDGAIYREAWKGTTITTEVACANFSSDE